MISIDLPIFYNKQWRKDVRNKLRQKFGSFMQKKCLYASQLTSGKTKDTVDDKELIHEDLIYRK